MFWPISLIGGPSFDARTADILIPGLNRTISSPVEGKFNLLQAHFSPNEQYITDNMFSSLETLSVEGNKAVGRWLNDIYNSGYYGSHGVNGSVVMLDFVGDSNRLPEKV